MEDAATIRRMFERQFGARSHDPSAVGQLPDSAMRCAEADAVESGFVRCSSRITHRCPRASFTEKDYLSSPTEPARLLYRAFSWRLAPGHLGAELYRSLQARVDWVETSGALYGRGGYAYQYVARASVMCVSPKMIFASSLPQPPYSELPSETWAYNSALDDVARMAAPDVARNFDEGPAPQSCAWKAGCALSWGGPRMLLPPDAGPRCRMKGQFTARQLLDSGAAETMSICLREDWERVVDEWLPGVSTPYFEFTSGCPIRF